MNEARSFASQQATAIGSLVRREKIDYTNYLLDKPQETDPAKLSAMKAALSRVLKEKGLHGHISCMYYVDGRVKVSIDGEYYNVFDSNTGKFFSGYVGSRQLRGGSMKKTIILDRDQYAEVVTALSDKLKEIKEISENLTEKPARADMLAWYKNRVSVIEDLIRQIEDAPMHD